MKKLHVALLMGGPSHEYEVSLKTGAQILKALDQKRYLVTPVVISRKKTWLFPGTGGGKKIQLATPEALIRLREIHTDVALIAMHGTFGEDGQVQLLLETVGIPYTGSGVAASAIAINKVHSARLFRAHGIRVPRSVDFSRYDWQRSRDKVMDSVKLQVPFPWVVKPVNLGSSVGVRLVREEAHLAPAIREALRLTDQTMVQELIEGREATCGVLQFPGKPLFALPPIYIVPKSTAFYDYKAKYAEGGSDHIIPAPFAREVNEAIKDIAVKAHFVLGCAGCSRTDLIVSDRGIYTLETNTIPGMTETSLLPQAAAVHGIPFPELIHKLIVAALA